jgi:hypothetical protein
MAARSSWSCPADDVTLSEASWDEDAATSAAFLWMRLVSDIGEPAISFQQTILQPEETSATSFRDQYLEFALNTAFSAPVTTSLWHTYLAAGLFSFSDEAEIRMRLPDIRSLLRSLSMPHTGWRRQLEQELVARFGKFEQVERIHLIDSSQGIRVYVWLDQTEYDDELMDALLDQEWAIGERFADRAFEAFYFPMPRDDAQLPVPDKAELIFG